jgi:5-formyltetrahydrofolate cyclo-ligase
MPSSCKENLSLVYQFQVLDKVTMTKFDVKITFFNTELNYIIP